MNNKLEDDNDFEIFFEHSIFTFFNLRFEIEIRQDE